MVAVDNYIQSFPQNIQTMLLQIREVILANAPGVEEAFAYNMPAYRINGKPLVYFAGFKNHIGLYATPSGHSHFANELAGYKQGKGSVQFPVNSPLPINLIGRIVQFRVAENLQKTKK